MKNAIIICLMALLSVSALSQTTNDDRINLKSGKVIKCNIISIDSVQMSINYYVSGQRSSVPLSQVASYSWDGVINAKYPSSVKTEQSKPEYITSPIEDKNSAGQQLIKFANNAQTGLTLEIIGSVVTSASILSNNAKTQKIMIASGITLSTIGFIVHIASYSKARKAGELLQIKENMALKISDTGLGLALTF